MCSDAHSITLRDCETVNLCLSNLCKNNNNREVIILLKYSLVSFVIKKMVYMCIFIFDSDSRNKVCISCFNESSTLGKIGCMEDLKAKLKTGNYALYLYFT